MSSEFENIMKRVQANPQQYEADLEAVRRGESTLADSPDVLFQKSPEGQARSYLSILFQSFADAVTNGETNQAEEFLAQAKTIATQYSIAWDSLPGGWKVFEAKLSELG